MNKINPYIVLAASLLVALGPWVEDASSWSELLQTGNIGVFIGIVGGVVLAWYGRSPSKPK